MAKELKGSKTHENLKEAFAGESQANRRYLYFAKQADIEGFPDVAGLFRDTADGETGHAHGHLDFLKQVGDPATGEPIGGTEENLKSAVAGGALAKMDINIFVQVGFIVLVGLASKNAILVVSVEIFQSITAPGNTSQNIDFVPTPFVLGRSLQNRVIGLLSPFLDVESICQ